MNNRILSLLGLSCRAGKAVLGFMPTQAALAKNKVKLIIIARDLSAHTREKVERLSQQKNVPLFEVPDRQELSTALGRDNLAVIGITCKEMAKALKESFSSADR
jgi:ribosomal protein L7Ae-like RNA K-turn-binding protein